MPPAMMATLFIGEFSFLFSSKEGGAGVARNSVNIEFGLEFVLSVCRRAPLYLGLSFRGLIMRGLLWGRGRPFLTESFHSSRKSSSSSGISDSERVQSHLR